VKLKLAKEKATQVLDEELEEPTVKYVPAPPTPGTNTDPTLAALTMIHLASELPNERLRRPRSLMEDATLFRFESINYTLLQGLLSQLSQIDRLGLSP
jgi:hypothetical protein